jgi:hypothetical protein
MFETWNFHYMLYQLPDGRTIELSIHEFLSATEEELNQLIGTNYGMDINNPRYGSIITKPGRMAPDDDQYTGFDIHDVPEEEKFNDQDYTPDE